MAMGAPTHSSLTPFLDLAPLFSLLRVGGSPQTPRHYARGQNFRLISQFTSDLLLHPAPAKRHQASRDRPSAAWASGEWYVNSVPVPFATRSWRPACL